MNTSNDFDYTPTFKGMLKQLLAVGYNLLYALLEFTDNSVSKGSTFIKVILEKSSSKPYVLNRLTVFDDGIGMTSQVLKDSFIIAGTPVSRDVQDIGSFRVGMKYGAMNIGTMITIISKVENGNIVGLHANVDQMENNNTFRPTDFCSSVDDEWAIKYLSPGLFDKFKTVAHGTMIHISSLRQKSKIRYDTILDEVTKELTQSYVSLYNECVISIYDGDSLHKKIDQIDLFYNKSPELLDETPYETELRVYTANNGCERVVEVNTQKRQFTAAKKTTSGQPGKPQFIEWMFGETPKGKKKLISKSLTIDELPEKSDMIGSVNMRTIQVNETSFQKEKNYFQENTPLYRDRKRFWFLREIRYVSTGNSMGKKIHDRSNSVCERQRTQVKFTPASDDLVGSKFNKQMDNKELPCRLLGDVIFGIHERVVNVWNANAEAIPFAVSNRIVQSDNDDSSGDDSDSYVFQPTAHSVPDTQEVTVPVVEVLREKFVPVVVHTETVVEMPETVVEMPETVVEMPEPVVEMPEPVVEMPEPVVEMPEPVDVDILWIRNFVNVNIDRLKKEAVLSELRVALGL
jgi:hypothetical protein